MTLPTTGLQLQSMISAEGLLELSLHEVPVPAPATDEVLIRVEATPINPSDIGLLFGAADMSTVRVTGTAERPLVRAHVPPASMKSMLARADQWMPVGNEGAGTVVATGSAPAAKAF